MNFSEGRMELSNIILMNAQWVSALKQESSKAVEMNQVWGPQLITGTCPEECGLKTYFDESSESKWVIVY
jgi:hypothetical protein